MAIRLQGNAIDLAVWKPPTRNRIDRHGEQAIEKLPTQRSMLMLNPAGHLVWVALHSGSGNRAPNDPMALRIQDEKQRKGFLPTHRCPQTIEGAQDHLPKPVRGRAACTQGKAGGKITSENPCTCLVETMDHRTELNVKKDREHAERYKTQEQRDRELQARKVAELEKQNSDAAAQARIKQLEDQLATMAAAIEALSKKGK